MDKRVGFIGTGEIAAIHASVIRRMSGGLVIAGGYDTLQKSAETFCGTFGGRVYRSAVELIEDNDIEAVYICTRHDSHATLSMAAMDAGKCIFLEKPLAMNGDDAMKLLESHKKNSVPMAVGFNMRVSPANLRFKELMAKLSVKPESFRASMTAAPFMNGWASDPTTGGGVLVCLGSHMFDLIVHLLGSPIKRVCASVQHISQPRGREGDSATILIVLENGVCGTLLIHDRGSREYHVEPEGRMTNVTVYSRQGTFDIDAYGRVRYGTTAGFVEETPAGGSDQCRRWGYEQENREFLRLVNGEATELCTIEQAAQVVIAVDASRRSDMIRGWVDVIVSKP